VKIFTFHIFRELEPGNVGIQPEIPPEFSSLRPEFQPGFENFWLEYIWE
jgi:hypothetical protein